MAPILGIPPRGCPSCMVVNSEDIVEFNPLDKVYFNDKVVKVHPLGLWLKGRWKFHGIYTLTQEAKEPLLIQNKLECGFRIYGSDNKPYLLVAIGFASSFKMRYREFYIPSAYLKYYNYSLLRDNDDTILVISKICK